MSGLAYDTKSVSGITVDLLSKSFGNTCTRNGGDIPSTAVDFGSLLQKHKKAVLIGLPGAFTPTCSQAHFPNFISRMSELKSKGVEALYCMSVNDAYAMQAWGDALPGCWDSGAIMLVADGNGDATKALGLECDCSEWRMGTLRCKRFAAVVVDGQFTALNVDEDGLKDSSVEAILALL